LGRVIATRNASGKEDGFRKIIIDFKDGKLDKLPAQLPGEDPVEAVIKVNDEGEIIEQQLYKLDPTDNWRLVFQLRRKAIGSIADSLTRPIINPPPLEIQAHLTQGDNILTETWSNAIWS
jgi:glucan biosynthesis protein